MADGPELEQQASSERSRAYLGRAKILIHKLVFEADKSCEARPLDGKNVSRLHNIFELEGCSRLDPDNYVPTLINRKVLADALGKGGSLDVSLGGCGELSLLEVEEPLICLHGRHRLAAATRYFFQPEQKWWIVDLYLDDLNPSVVTALKEAYSNSRNFCDGDIFRNLRYCQLRNDEAGAGKWMARLSESKQTDVAQLQNMAKKTPEMAALQDALDALLPFVGLWSPVSIGVFHRLLTLRCPEELSNCLALIKTTWEQTLEPTGTSYFHLDANTVHIIQGRSLLTSSEDYHFIENCMQDGILFPTVMDRQQRLGIFRRLSVIPYLIPSLYTFIEDTKHIEPSAKIMKRLLPPRFKGSVRQAFGRLHTGQTQIMEQRSETVFRPFSHSAKECFQVAYQQLWLFAMRRSPEMTGIQPRKDAGRPMKTITGGAEEWWHRFGELASKGGFGSAQIHHLCTQNPEEKMIRDFLHQARPSDVYQFDETVFNSEVQRISRSLSDVQPRDIHRPAAEFSSDAQRSLKLSERCGRPFYQSFLLDRKVLFREVIYNDDSEPVEVAGQRRRNITSLAVKRDTFRAFFGNLAPVSRIGTVMSSANDGGDASTVPVSHSPSRSPQSSARRDNFNQHQANLPHKYRLEGSLPDTMLPSNLLHNFIQTNLQDQSTHIMLYDLDLTRFHCIESTEINFNHFVLRHEGCVYYCIDQTGRLGTVGLRELYNTILKSKNIVFFENSAQTRTGSRSRTMTDLDALKLEMTVCETVDNRTPFLEKLPSS